MDKASIIQALEAAEKNHRIQYKKTKAMLLGVESTKPTPKDKKDCDFGQWLYANEALLLNLLGSQFYGTLEELHARWHDQYHAFFDLYYKESSGGFFSKTTLIFQTLNETEHAEAEVIFGAIDERTQSLLKHLTICKRRLYALPENYFTAKDDT